MSSSAGVRCLPGLVIKQGRVHLSEMKEFINKHWPKFQKVYKYLLYGTRSALMLYVAWFAITSGFYAWGIAFVYFAFVDYWNKFYIQ